MSSDIEISWGDLLRQAMLTSDDYFQHAVRTIDGKFGGGYAEKNPALIVGLITASSADFLTGHIAVASQKIARAISDNQ